jgi:hypothetical protein
MSYSAMGTVISMIDAFLKGRKPSLGSGWRDAKKNISGIAALAAVSEVMDLVASGLRDRGRTGFSSMIASWISEVWTVASFLILPIIMIEDVGLQPALSRARTIHQKNLLQIASGEIGLVALGRIAHMVLLLLMGVLALILFPAGLAGIVGVIALTVVGSAAISALNTFARASYYTSLYLWARELEAAQEGDRSQVCVPESLVAALA